MLCICHTCCTGCICDDCMHAILHIFSVCTCWIYDVVYILYCVHDGYEMLYAYGALCMLDMYSCVQMMLAHVVLCKYGVVCMIVQVVLCACGVVYMLYKWCYVQVVLFTCPTCGTVYMWHHIHVIQMVLCTCGIVYMLYSGVVYIGCCVHVV